MASITCTRAVDKGYYVAPVLEGRSQFDAVRDAAGVPGHARDAREKAATHALAAFRDAGGERLLGRR